VPPVLWNGLRYRWRATSHRLSHLGSRFTDDGHETALRIGAFPPDKATVKAWYTRLDGLPVARGVSRVRVQGPIGQTVTARVEATLPPEVGEHGVGALPLLAGFRVAPEANRSGWHFGRLALRLYPVERRGDRLAFDLQVLMRPSEAPELFHFGNVGWSYDLDCSYDVDVEWLVLLPTAPLPFEEGTWTTTVHRGLDVEHSDEVVLERPASPTCPCAVGVRGLDLEVGSVAGQRRRSRVLRYHTGRNIRELGLWVELDALDDTSVRLRPGVAMSNRPRGSVGYQLLLTAVVLAAFVGALLIDATTVRILLAMLGAGVGLVGLIWPGGPWAFPSVPWSLRTALDLVVVGLPDGAEATSGDVSGLHDVPDEPHTSTQPFDG